MAINLVKYHMMIGLQNENFTFYPQFPSYKNYFDQFGQVKIEIMISSFNQHHL